MVSVIIAAFNESPTVGACVADVVGHAQVSEIIVVDDGSSDDTAEQARRAGARVITLPENRGKALALDAGVAVAREDVLLFIDADVTGLTHEVLSRIMRPVIEGRYEMFVGVRARKTLWLNRLLRVFPIIGGERALTRALWQRVPQRHKRGFRIEIALNHTAKHCGGGMGFELIEGVVHRTKERKFGWWRGFWRRLRMIGEVTAVTWSLYVIGGLASLLGIGRHDRVRDAGG
jgi:polyprenyl-phospho-N-acetylgalactosaminyl synthase